MEGWKKTARKVSSDVPGHSRPASEQGHYHYVVTFVDEYGKDMLVRFMRTETEEVAEKFQGFIAQNGTPKTLRKLMEENTRKEGWNVSACTI